MESQPTTDTSNFLDWVEIKNFKSIKDLRLDCKRVNVFIGKPNVGKSNILEALGMLGTEYFPTTFMSGAVRYRDLKHLFYQNDPINAISIRTAKLLLNLTRDNNKQKEYTYRLEKAYPKNKFLPLPSSTIPSDYEKDLNYFITQKINASGKIEDTNKDGGSGNYINIRKYDFTGISDFVDTYEDFLLPNGQNLFQIIDRRISLKNEFGKIFSSQDLDLVLDRENQSFNLQRKDGFYIYKFDFFSIADTFRRFMFYIAAIESNTNSVLIFEEPEVHSFPPYTQDVAYRMIYSESNQFFVSTHSPYLLQTLVENLSDDQLQVFVTYYDKYETKVKALSAEEFSFVQEYSTDVFFNLDRFIPTPDAASIS